METLALLGLVSNVVQFVAFAKDLISTSIEVHQSSSGISDDILHVNTVYGQLSGFGAGIKMFVDADFEAQSDIAPALAVMRQLSLVCKVDCSRLLKITEKLQVNANDKSRWKSFKAGLRAIMEQNEISQMEKRLDATQTALTLHICTVLSYWQAGCAKELADLKKESSRLQTTHSAKLDDIGQSLLRLEQRLTLVKSQRKAIPFIPDDVASLEKEIRGLSLSKNTVAGEQDILKSLSFPTRPVRREVIRDAHAKTFGWIFQQPTERVRPSRLYNWLMTGRGTFWVSGKPGSGKSTFMKFVADHPTTMTLASHNHPDRKTIRASHYFWIAGTEMQKSQQGLLRELLFDMFRQCPELIALACAHRVSSDTWDTETPWATQELQGVLATLASGSCSSVTFTIFIDGLDEYDGDHEALCTALKTLADSPYIKLCVSSRPWNVFEEAFGQNEDSKLYMQDLTKHDIKDYTKSRLEEHPRWQAVASRPGQGVELVQEIVDKACGVFLWVYLVTELLRKGLTNRDSFSDMRRRLESFPPELEDFFQRILESVEAFYHSKMSTALQLAAAADEPLHWTFYAFHEQEYDDADYVFRVPNEAFSREELRELRLDTATQLNSRTQGLLEITGTGLVTFLHRTVKDYLDTTQMSDFLAAKAAPWFSANLTLIRAGIARIKRNLEVTDVVKVIRGGFGKYAASEFMTDITRIFACASAMEELGPSNTHTHDLLDELEDSILEKERKGQITFDFGVSGMPTTAFLGEHVITHQLVSYLRKKLSSNPLYLPNTADLTSFTLFETSTVHWHLTTPWRSRGPEMLGCILNSIPFNFGAEQGTDTEACLEHRRFFAMAWRNVMEHVTTWDNSLSEVKFWDLLRHDILSLLISKGASSIARSKKDGYTMIWVDYLFLCFRIAPNPERESQYLRTLDSFLFAPNNRLSAESTRRCKLDDSTDTSPVCEEYFKKLTRLKIISPSQVSYSLITEVTHQLLVMVRDSDKAERWPAALIRAAIEEGLPFKHRKSLEARHPEVMQGPPTHGMRPADTSGATEGRPLRRAPVRSRRTFGSRR